MPLKASGGEMTLAKPAKNAERSGFAGKGVNGGGTFLSPTISFERGTGMSPRLLLIRFHP